MISDPIALATLGGGIAQAGGLIGSSWGIGIAGAAGAAMLSQERGQMRNVIILASLPMTQAFYGLITMILVLSRVIPNLAATPNAGGSGFAVFALGIMAGLTFAIAGAYLGSVCSSGIAFLSKTHGGILTNSIMLAVFVELISVLALVFSIMALSMLGLM